MNPSSKETPAPRAPSSAEQLAPPEPAALAEAAPARGEQPALMSEKAPLAPAPAAGAFTVPLPNPVPGMPAPAAGAAAQSSSLQANDDSDLIEKEWVDKAKQIVERTRNDPHKQSEELTVFKADYLKKRYGKTIKVSQ